MNICNIKFNGLVARNSVGTSRPQKEPVSPIAPLLIFNQGQHDYAQFSVCSKISPGFQFADSQNTDKDKILKIMRKEKLAVISTSSPLFPTPESALIAFAEDDQLQLYFQTQRNTRKVANLQANPYVSLVIGWQLNDLVTIQYEGKAEQLNDPAAIEVCKQRFLAKDSPTTLEYLNHPSTIFFKVTPTWIGCSDYSGKHPEVIEIKDF